MPFLLRNCFNRRRFRCCPKLVSLETRSVPATISGQTFKDLNANGMIDAGEVAQSGVRVFLDSNNNGIIDNGSTTTFTNSTAATISSTGAPLVTSTLPIATVGQINDLNFKINVTHTSIGQLHVTLQSPAGTSTTLIASVGGTGDNYTNTVLDDEAATFITAGAAPFTGTFKPSPGLLSIFDGQSMNGTWTLSIRDTVTGTGGTLNSWSLEITAAGETSVFSDAAGNYSFAGLAAGMYHVGEVVPTSLNRTFPGGDGRHHLTLAAPDTSTGNNFGNRLPPATISGLVFNDTNSNGIQNAGELPVAGVTIYLDKDKNGIFSAGDPSTTSDAAGNYSFTDLEPYQSYIVAEVSPIGFVHIAPTRTTAASTNVNSTKRTGHQVEECIAIDPANPNRIFMASNDLLVTGMSASTSSDGGATWSNRTMATGTDITAANGDPSAAFDMFGNLWITYLSDSGFNTIVARSTDGGASFKNFAAIAFDTDQCTITAGPSSTPGRALVAVCCQDGGGQVVSYLEVDAAGPIGTFTNLISVTNSSSGITGQFSDIAIGPGGKVAIAYVNAKTTEGPDNIYFNLDPDGIGPNGFGARQIVTSTNVGAFDTIPAQPNRTVDSQPDLEWDCSGGINNGRLYLLYTEEFGAESNDFNVMLRYSDNNGSTWTSAKQINDASTLSQFLPHMSLDQSTGYVAFSWYDCRNDPSNVQTEFWGSVSLDGGQTFKTNFKLSGGKSTFGTSGFDYGDYTGIGFAGGRFVSAWGDNSNSTLDNPNSTSAMDVLTARVVVGNNDQYHIVVTLPVQSYSARDFAIKGTAAPAPTVTINQAAGQVDPTNGTTINFTVVFSAPVSDFTTGDITLGGSAGATTAIVTGSGTTYDVAVSGMTMTGSVIASIAAGVATNGGTGNLASTSTDNTVTFDNSLPTAVSTPGNVSNYGDSNYQFTVTFSDNLAIDGATFDGNDIRVTGPGGFDVAAAFVMVDVLGNGTPRTVTYNIMPPAGYWDAADNGTYSVILQNGQVADTAGNQAAGMTLATFDVAVPAPLMVSKVQVNDNSLQRSLVTSLTIEFSGAVTLPVNPADAFQLVRQSPAGAVSLHAVVAANSVTLDFTGGIVDGASLADGIYTLTVFKSQTSGGNFDSAGTNVPGDDFVYVGNTTTQKLFRLFGDADGSANVNADDFAIFRGVFGLIGPSIFDFDGNNQTNSDDFGQFRARFGMMLSP